MDNAVPANTPLTFTNPGGRIIISKIMRSRYIVGYYASRGVLTVYWRWGERTAYEDRLQDAATSLESMRVARRLHYTCNFKFDMHTPEEMNVYTPMASSDDHY